MENDDAQTLLDEVLREWQLLGVDESLAKSRLAAIAPLQQWLQKGVKGSSAEVAIRAVQTLLADPETPGMDKRPAVQDVIRSISKVWTTAGVGTHGIAGLQALLIASWPYGTNAGGFALVPLLDLAWSANKHPPRHRKRIEQWRQSISRPPDVKKEKNTPLEKMSINTQGLELNSPKTQAQIQYLKSNAGSVLNYNQFSNQLIAALEAHESDIRLIASQLPSIGEQIGNSLNKLKEQLNSMIERRLQKTQSEHDLLWWGQSRYSTVVRKPYRHIKNSTERLWWMASEASDLAVELDVEPAASFMVETLRAVDGDLDTQRPLKDWLSELIKVLRDLHGTGLYNDASLMKMNEKTEKLARKDALGLPVTWARLRAREFQGQDIDWEMRAREEVALDLDTLLDRGSWATWIFREQLLDWKLGES